jgi:hypothetical protein
MATQLELMQDAIGDNSATLEHVRALLEALDNRPQDWNL